MERFPEMSFVLLFKLTQQEGLAAALTAKSGHTFPWAKPLLELQGRLRPKRGSHAFSFVILDVRRLSARES